MITDGERCHKCGNNIRGIPVIRIRNGNKPECVDCYCEWMGFDPDYAPYCEYSLMVNRKVLPRGMEVAAN